MRHVITVKDDNPYFSFIPFDKESHKKKFGSVSEDNLFTIVNKATGERGGLIDDATKLIVSECCSIFPWVGKGSTVKRSIINCSNIINSIVYNSEVIRSDVIESRLDRVEIARCELTKSELYVSSLYDVDVSNRALFNVNLSSRYKRTLIDPDHKYVSININDYLVNIYYSTKNRLYIGGIDWECPVDEFFREKDENLYYRIISSKNGVLDVVLSTIKCFYNNL